LVFSILTIPAFLTAGCLADAPDQEPLRSFRATYRAEGETQIEVAFGGPVLIADRDFTRRLAYPLDVEIPQGAMIDSSGVPSPAFHLRYYLDTSLTVVRADSSCISEGPECETHVLVDWTVQGLPPPFGMFWNRFEPLHPATMLGARVDWKFEVQHGRETQVVQEGLPGNKFLDLTGPVVLTEHDFPKSFAGSVTLARKYSVSANLADFGLGPPVDNAESWPIDLFTGQPWQNPPRQFENERESVPGRTFSYEEALNQLLSRSEPARETVQNGCIVGVKVIPLSGDAPGMEAAQSLFAVNYTTITYRIGVGDSYREFELEYRSGSPLQQENWEVRETGKSGPASCVAKNAIRPTTQFTAFLAQVRTIPIPGEFSINTFGVVYNPPSPDRNAIGGTVYYAAPYNTAERPANGVIVPNQVFYLAGPGWWDHVYLPRQAVGSLDSGLP
jgi:hypothetical protein